ncbi:MAG: glycosyltransferase family 2 protein [Bdellovibrio sp.]
MKISVVIPTYGAPNSVIPLHQKLVETFKEMACTYEIIFVNDACPRGSWEQIESLCSNFDHVKGLNLARNFGQHAAIEAGLNEASGDWMTVMDCDLQDDPIYIPQFLKAALESKSDVVLARRIQRQERFFKRFQSWAFYKALSMLDVNMDHRIGNFGLYSKKIIDATKSMGDRIRFFPYLISWLKFPTTYVDIIQNQREEGSSSYTLKKALNLAINVALSSSNRPLLWSVQTGAFCALGAFALGILFILRYFTLGLAPSGWTSLAVAIFFSTGLILLNLGILGLYFSRMYDQVRSRPTYIIKEVLKRN